MDQAPLQANIFVKDPGSKIDSPTWTIWFNKLVALVDYSHECHNYSIFGYHGIAIGQYCIGSSFELDYESND